MDDLERRFHAAMVGVYRAAKEQLGYNATRYIQMVGELGGAETARRLIHSDAPSDGYSFLWEHGRLDLSVEALVADNDEWHPLFSRADIDAARQRLGAYGYRGT